MLAPRGRREINCCHAGKKSTLSVSCVPEFVCDRMQTERYQRAVIWKNMVRICISNCWEQEVDGEILLLGMKRLPAITGAVRNGGAARAHSKFGPGKGVCVCCGEELFKTFALK
jgi:hypothetical protein